MTAVAVVQRPPALLDLNRSMALALEALEEAARGGAELVVFPETFLPGYPTWVWRLRPGGDMKLVQALHERLLANAVDIDGNGLAPLCEAAARLGVTVVMGLNERDSAFSRTTLFNTVVVIGPDGRILNRHRKLIPTNPERMVWGRGDGRGLQVVDTPVGRISTLICWENYMPLARYAMYAQGVDIYIAPTWDCGETWVASMRHIAREGGCWVIGCAAAMQGRDVPEDFPERERVFTDPDEWLCKGDSVIVAPAGRLEVGPLSREQGILRADIDVSQAAASRRTLEVAGHYGRPDVFQLQVRRTAVEPIVFHDEAAGAESLATQRDRGAT